MLLRRALWQGLLSPIARWLPRPFNPLRIALLRAAGAKIGKHCLIKSGIRVLMPWQLVLGDCVSLGHDVELYNYARIQIGANTVVSQYSYLCTGTHDYTHPHMPLTWQPITIGSECWIAAGVFVAPGVVIGDGTVVGARSVVTKSLPAWKICAGNPCKAIKERVIHPET